MRSGARTAIDSIPEQVAPQGTALSFDEAFTLHHRTVFATARAVVRDSAVAEEVTQEVFLKLYRHFDSAPDPELLRPWLLRVTLNEARNTIRGQSRAMARDTTYQKSTDETVTPSFEYENRQQTGSCPPGAGQDQGTNAQLLVTEAPGIVVPGNRPDPVAQRKLCRQSGRPSSKGICAHLREDGSKPMRNCIDEGTLQSWFDGELDTNAAANVTAHLHSCVTCAEAASTLEAENLILSEGLAAEFAAAIPTERLRQRVDAAVAGLQVAGVAPVKRSWWSALGDLLPSFRVLAYTSATAAVLLAGWLAVVYLKRDQPTALVAIREACPKSLCDSER